jgi:RimJ/RimL family protein N-acetyltransferase
MDAGTVAVPRRSEPGEIGLHPELDVEAVRRRQGMCLDHCRSRRGAPVGAIRIRGWRWGEIGYESHPDFWDRGLMTEAVRAVVFCARSQFKLHRVEAWTSPGNAASDRVLASATRPNMRKSW